MANTTDKIILEDGPRNAIVRLVGTLDTSNVSLVPAILLSDFVNNDLVWGKLTGLRVDRIDYASGPQLITTLEWNSNSPQMIAALVQSDELDYKNSGGLIPNRLLGGYDGSINLKTKGFIAGNYEAYTVLIKMVKLYTNQ